MRGAAGRAPRLLVALAPVRDLFLCAKHLFVAAMNGNFLGGLSRAAGRPNGSGRGKVEAYCSLDVSRLNKAGCLSIGWSARLAMERATVSRSHGSISAPSTTRCTCPTVRATAAGMGRTWPRPSASSQVPCRLGGARPVLYLSWRGERGRLRPARLQAVWAGALISCAGIANRLAHASQSEGAWDLQRRAVPAKSGERLGGEPCVTAAFPAQAERHVAAHL